jgi:flagellar protein FliO/FliZ
LSVLKSLNNRVINLSTFQGLPDKEVVIKGFNVRFVLSSLMVASVNAFAQEEAVEVGKHANPNLDAMSMIISLLMVLALIIASAWILKKFNFANKSVSGMQIISSLPLGHKEKLVVVQVAQEQLLLGVSGQQINLIKVLDKPLEIGAPISADLGQTLNRLFTKTSNNQATEIKPSKDQASSEHSANNPSSSV